MRTRKTSQALTELRTVITRADTARKFVEKSSSPNHTPHEIALMAAALKNAHDALHRVEQLTGYEGKND